MAFGLWRYSVGRKLLPHTPAPNPLRPEKVKTAVAVGVLIVLVVGSLIASDTLNLDNFSKFLLGTVIFTVIVYFARLLGSGMAVGFFRPYEGFQFQLLHQPRHFFAVPIQCCGNAP